MAAGRRAAADEQVVTSRVFADRYMTNGEVVTHSHGPQGMHSHGLIDFNTWMDPTQAALQAQSIHDELARLIPEATKDFDVNLKALQQDLSGIDAAMQRASAPLGNAPLLGLASGLSLCRAPLRLEFEERPLGAGRNAVGRGMAEIRKTAPRPSRQNHDLGRSSVAGSRRTSSQNGHRTHCLRNLRQRAGKGRLSDCNEIQRPRLAATTAKNDAI